MPSPSGNLALNAARQAAGLSSHRAFIDALTRAAEQLGMGKISISTRQVGRWHRENPPWPRAEHQRLLVHVLNLPVERLGFRPPWEASEDALAAGAARVQASAGPARTPLPRPAQSTAVQPATVGATYAMVTRAHRSLYWTVAPSTLHQAVMEHANLGTVLLGETSGITRRILASALAESLLLAGRIQFFDLRQPTQADGSFVRALQAASEADDSLLGAAVLAHTAFIPGWAGRRDEAAERMQAARTYARRGPASGELLAWLDAVEAECLTRCGDHRAALTLLRHAEDVLAADGEYASPDWLDWFSSTRLAAFKGNTELKAGHLPQARETLRRVLEELADTDGKQRTVVLGDLAAVEAALGRPEEAGALLEEALDQLSVTYYATGMERVRESRRVLQRWQDSAAVRRVDDRLYSWGTTLSVLQR